MSEGHPKAPIGATCLTRTTGNQYVKTLDGWKWVGEYRLGHAGFPEWELDGLYWEQKDNDKHSSNH